MNPQVQDILRHGYLWLFLAALLERLGLPLLVTPVMVAAGAVAGIGDLSLLGIVLVTVVASEIGDLVWYELGRSQRIVGAASALQDFAGTRFLRAPVGRFVCAPHDQLADVFEVCSWSRPSCGPGRRDVGHGPRRASCS